MSEFLSPDPDKTKGGINFIWNFTEIFLREQGLYMVPMKKALDPGPDKPEIMSPPPPGLGSGSTLLQRFLLCRHEFREKC